MTAGACTYVSVSLEVEPQLRNNLLPCRGAAKRARRQIFQHRRQVPRKRVPTLDGLACNRVIKAHAPRMQKLPRKIAIGTVIALTIERIAHTGMVDIAHVHTNLMRAAGIKVTLQKRVAVVTAGGVKALKHPERSDSLARHGVVRYGHLHTIAR